MTGPLPDPPDLDPPSLAGSSFGRSRRGFEPTEVRSMLGRAADALRVWAERDAKLVQRIEELSARLDEAEEFDEARVTQVLGHETARIVAAARDAAAEMRGQAESDAAELTERTRAEAESSAEALIAAAVSDREAAEKARSEAEAAATAALTSATESAERMVLEATESSETMVTAAREESESILAAAREEADALRSEAQRHHDELTESASTVLEERTTEAEAAATAIRSTAEAELAEASETAAANLAGAEAEARRLAEAAEQEAAEMREAARAEGREMVEEARDLRRQMLHDAADKAKVGRQKVEAAKAAREAVVNAIRTAGGRLGETLADLEDSDAEMRRAADAAALAVSDDVHSMAVDLERGLDRTSPDAPEDAPPADSGNETGSEETGSDETGSDEVGLDEVEGATVVLLAEDTLTDSGDPEPEEASIASVHDLFERIRAEDAPTDAPTDAAARESTNVAVLDARAQADTADEMNAVSSGSDGEESTAAANGSDDSGHAPTEPASVEQVSSDVSGVSGDAVLLERRSELLAPAGRLTTRAVKRLFGDEQNDVLDRARRLRRNRAEVSDLLGEDDSAAVAHFVEVLTEPYVLAAAAGCVHWGELSHTEPAPPSAADVLERLDAQVSGILELRRARVRDLLAAHVDAGADASELVDKIRSVYRDYRGSDAGELAGDLAAGAFAAGSSFAAGTGSSWRWVVDNGGRPCADAEDNALEGAVVCGSPFPTGDTVPPAHPGCRCIVVPVDESAP